MKHLLLLISAMLTVPLLGYGQIYFDPAVAAATATHAGVINSQLSGVNENLTLIQRGQLAITSKLTLINTLQDNIYKGLTEVSAAMYSLLTVKDIADVSLDILENVDKVLQMAKANPILLLFAEQGAKDFKTRAGMLGTEVSSFVLKGGKDNLLDSGERAKLLSLIRTNLNILRGITFGMHRSMFWAQQRGILNSLNPYSGFINIDRNIADDIIRNSKLIRK